jgi:caspase domain-containing protein
MIPSLPDPAGSRAVLIGTSVYTDPDLPDIPSVANNLTDLAELLTSPQGTGLPSEHVAVVENPAAQAEVGDRILQAAEEADKLLLVYYSGHGLMTWGRGNELCLSLRDTRSKAVRTSALRCADLRQYILDSGARTRVLILDCCYGGRTIEPTLANPAEALLAQVDIEGAYVLTAAENEALAPPGQRNTLFTGELLRIFRDGVPGEPGLLLSLDALYTEVKSVMRRRNLPAPQCNSRGTAAHLAIVPNKAHRVHRLLAGLRTDIDALAAEEAETDLVYAKTIDRIASPNLPPLAAAAHGLRDRLAELDLAATGGQPPSADQLGELHGALIAALNSTKRLRELAAGPLDWRDQLRAKLDGYQVEAVTRGIAEDTEIAKRYRMARDLVWTKPCPLGAATRAVNAYQQAVIDRRERHE